MIVLFKTAWQETRSFWAVAVNHCSCLWQKKLHGFTFNEDFHFLVSMSYFVSGMDYSLQI